MTKSYRSGACYLCLFVVRAQEGLARCSTLLAVNRYTDQIPYLDMTKKYAAEIAQIVFSDNAQDTFHISELQSK
jgi:hypothetical protein